ncbi:nucleotidyltransferase substrate binding protein [bacterium]|nr:nucleotidyltransferase substrate binding protein [bacterium]
MKKYDNFCRPLTNLQTGLQLEEPYSVVEQAGIIGLFGICFEQSRKLMKDVLEKHGRFENKVGSPRAIIKMAFQCDLIKDEELWLELLETRYVLAHTYTDEESLAAIRRLKERYIAAFEALKAELDGGWLDVYDS